MVAGLGFLVVIVTSLIYVAAAFGVRRTFPTRRFDIGVAFGVVLSTIGALRKHGTGIAAVTWLGAARWFLLTRRELRVRPATDLLVSDGSIVPDFEVTTVTGHRFSNRDLVDSAPAVLIVYRGWWCPYCTTQLDAIRSEHEVLAANGIAVFALSTDPPDVASVLVERTSPFLTILCDPEGSALDAFGVRDRRRAPWYDRWFLGARRADIAAPASFVIDGSGRVAMASRSDRIDHRVAVSDIVRALS